MTGVAAEAKRLPRPNSISIEIAPFLRFKKEKSLFLPPLFMGTCRSSCPHSTELEYYDAWRKDQPIRGGRRHPTIVMDGALQSLVNMKSARPSRHHTKIWVCDRGCCSIRWKLDYAEFQSYTKYAEISPYVVVQENHDGCTCVICMGMPEQSLQCRLEQLDSTRRRRTVTAPLSETDEDDGDVADTGATRQAPIPAPVCALSPVA